jgi:transcriptional regulator GlxA family with amidase domain
MQWLRRSRIRRSQYLLETTGHSVERIALQVGFGSPTSFREHFKRLVDTIPQAYRRAFQGSRASGPQQSSAGTLDGVARHL